MYHCQVIMHSSIYKIFKQASDNILFHLFIPDSYTNLSVPYKHVLNWQNQDKLKLAKSPVQFYTDSGISQHGV